MKRHKTEGYKKSNDPQMALLTDVAAQAVIDLNTAHRNRWVRPDGEINRTMFSSRRGTSARAYEMSRTGLSRNKMSTLTIEDIEHAKTFVRSEIFREILSESGIDWTEAGIEKIIDRS